MTKRFFTTSLSAGQHSNGEVLNNANKEIFNNSANIPGFYPGHSKESMESIQLSPYMDPFSRISNVSNTYVEINDYNELMEKHGLKKRGSSKLHLVQHSTINKEMNRYLDNSFKVLNRLVDSNRPELFWRMALVLARRSSVFSALMITELEPNWHRFMNMKELHFLISKYRRF